MSTPEATPNAGPKPPKTMLFLGALMVLNLAATGFVAANTLSGEVEEVEEGADEAPEAAAEGEHGGGEEKAAEGEHGEGPTNDGPIVNLDPFVVNLDEPGSNRYLKAVFEVEMENSHAAADLNATKRSVRNEIFHYLSSLSVADTLGEQNKARIQREVLYRIEKEVGKDRVKKLYFTEFVVQ